MMKRILNSVRPQKRNIYELVYPFYWLSRILNLTHFSLVGELTDGRIQLTISNKVQCFIATAIFGMLFVYVIGQPYYNTNVKFIDVGNYIFILIAILYIDLAILLSSVNANYYWSIFKTVHKVDCTLDFLHFPVNHNHQFVQIIKYSIMQLSLSIGFNGYAFLRTNLTTVQSLYQIAPGFWYAFLMELYTTILYLSHARYVNMNECFRYYFLDTSSKTFKETRNVKRHDVIKEISEMYEDVCDINERLNKAFGCQIMICFVVYMLYSGFTIFATYLILFHHDPSLILNGIIFNIIFVFVYTIYFVLIITFSEEIKAESKTLSGLVHIAMREQSAVLIQNKINFFQLSQQMIHRKPVPSCGFFNFDWPLVYAVIGSICSYLIILIQFDNPNLLNMK